MHPQRKDRIEKELKRATALVLTVKVEFKLRKLPITQTIEFDQMPVLLFESEGSWVAKCLPINQIGIGEDKDSAIRQLGIDIAEMFKDVVKESRVHSLARDLVIGGAHKQYWKKFFELANQTQRESSKQVIRNPRPNVNNYGSKWKGKSGST